MTGRKEIRGASSLREDRVTDAPHEAACASSPCGSVPTGAWMPGPWSAVGLAVLAPDTHPEGQPETPWMVARAEPMCGFGMDTAEPNANLIAAAPDLYRILEGLAKAYALLDRDGTYCKSPGSWYAHAVAVLAKARGEAS